MNTKKEEFTNLLKRAIKPSKSLSETKVQAKSGKNTEKKTRRGTSASAGKK